MKRTTSYLTVDNQPFIKESDALKHELKINTRSIVATHLERGATFTATNLGEFISSHADKLFDLLSKHRAAMKRALARETSI